MAVGQTLPVSPSEISSCESGLGLAETLDPEAVRRLAGHERIVREVCTFAKEEAQSRRLMLLRIEIRPTWSHEYEDHSGVVIDTEIQATTEERFSYWDAMCERLNELADALSPEDRQFLNGNVSLIVTRS